MNDHPDLSHIIDSLRTPLPPSVLYAECLAVASIPCRRCLTVLGRKSWPIPSSSGMLSRLPTTTPNPDKGKVVQDLDGHRRRRIGAYSISGQDRNHNVVSVK